MDQDEQSGVQSLVTAIAICGFVLLAAGTAFLLSGPAQNWLGPLRYWSLIATLPKQGGAQTPQTPAAGWADNEIETALMQCVQTLAPIVADLAPLAPIKSGDCGTPAPVLVKSIGGPDKVSFDPPLVLDCAMVAGLDRWLRDSVQPAAREAFSSRVSKIIGSSYACRNVYNLPNGHLSQHAFANAVDLPVFVLADGRKVDVTHGWGPTHRDLIAAAKAKKQNTKGSVSDVVKISMARASNAAISADRSDASGVDPNAAAEGTFLRFSHDGGCKIFSTVLGPEANDVHRTHLHLDLQDRKTRVCK
jgi:hypothetical protein